VAWCRRANEIRNDDRQLINDMVIRCRKDWADYNQRMEIIRIPPKIIMECKSIIKFLKYARKGR
jgi:hypothetical protein